jgi:pyruvate dehydrogenase complex dehydrogenase (E1) component
MTLQEAQQLLADGKLLSESVDAAGILTQQWEFIGDRQLYRVTSVEGLVVKYTVEPR